MAADIIKMYIFCFSIFIRDGDIVSPHHPFKIVSIETISFLWFFFVIAALDKHLDTVIINVVRNCLLKYAIISEDEINYDRCPPKPSRLLFKWPSSYFSKQDPSSRYKHLIVIRKAFTETELALFIKFIVPHMMDGNNVDAE